MDTLYTFWDNITHYKTKSVHFLGLMNSATKRMSSGYSRLRSVPSNASGRPSVALYGAVPPSTRQSISPEELGANRDNRSHVAFWIFQQPDFNREKAELELAAYLKKRGGLSWSTIL